MKLIKNIKHYFKHKDYYLDFPHYGRSSFPGFGRLDNVVGGLGLPFGLALALWTSYPLYKFLIIPNTKSAMAESSMAKDILIMLGILAPVIIITIIGVLIYHYFNGFLSAKIGSDKKSKFVCELMDIAGVILITVFLIFSDLL